MTERPDRPAFLRRITRSPRAATLTAAAASLAISLAAVSLASATALASAATAGAAAETPRAAVAALRAAVVTPRPVAHEVPDTVVRAVDRLFARWDRPGSPGAAVGVFQDGEILYARGYGSAQLEWEAPITPSTVFHCASVSKQFTAYAVALLAERGALSLDDDVRRHLPELNDFGASITLRHLLHHTSGLRDQWTLLVMAGRRLDDVIRQEDVLSLVRRQRELNFPPGEQFLYSNSGYTLLAEVVTRVTGQPFAAWMKESVFEPLEMVDTWFRDDHERVVPGRAESYEADGEGGYRRRVLSLATVGATGLHTTVEDLARWAAHLDDPGRAESVIAGAGGAVRRMEERGVLRSGDTVSYALGQVAGRQRGLRTLEHGGGDAGFRSHLLRLPDRRFAVAVLANAAEIDPALLAWSVADLYLADAPDPGALAGPVADGPSAEVPAPDGPAAEVPVVRVPGLDVPIPATDPRGDRAARERAEASRERAEARRERTEARRERTETARPAGERGEAPAARLLGPEEAERVTGHYWSPATDEVHRVLFWRGRLFYQPAPWSAAELLPLDEGRFLAMSWPGGLEVHFQPAGSRAEHMLLVAGGGVPAVLRAVEPWTPTAAELRQYEGAYWSEELGIAYEIRSVDGGLAVHHPRYGEIPLFPAVPDVFTSSEPWLARVRFFRDDENRPAGFRAFSARVRGLLFLRLE